MIKTYKLRDFCNKRPEFKPLFRELLKDPNYIVRVDEYAGNLCGGIEVGYPSDVFRLN